MYLSLVKLVYLNLLAYAKVGGTCAYYMVHAFVPDDQNGMYVD